MERLSILQASCSFCKSWLTGLNSLFYPSPEFIGLLYLFLRMMSEIIKTEIWYNCVAKKIHYQNGTPCSATLQSSLRRRRGSESCCVKPISSHDLPIRAQKSPLATHGRWSTIQNYTCHGTCSSCTSSAITPCTLSSVLSQAKQWLNKTHESKHFSYFALCVCLCWWIIHQLVKGFNIHKQGLKMQKSRERNIPKLHSSCRLILLINCFLLQVFLVFQMWPSLIHTFPEGFNKQWNTNVNISAIIFLKLIKFQIPGSPEMNETVSCRYQVICGIRMALLYLYPAHILKIFFPMAQTRD